MRTKGERRHEGDAAQEENNISRVHIRERLVKIDFIVCPLELADHPESAGQGREHPEHVAAPMGRAGIQKEPSVGKERDEALRNVAECT